MDFAFDSIEHATKNIDAVMQTRIAQIDTMLDDKLNKFQEMLNGIKITVNVEMPVVKKTEPVQ
jgi:hypothetical protein